MADTNFILVVEDDPILKNLLGHTFAGKYQTLYASNGAEALALFDQYTPAVVLLDLMLPDMDGFTILQKIRERPDASKSVPVIIVSNLGQQADKDRAMALGANDYIVKAEVEIEEIVKRLEALIGPAQAAPAAAATPAALPLVDVDPTALHTTSAEALQQIATATPGASAGLPTAPHVGEGEGTEDKPFVI